MRKSEEETPKRKKRVAWLNKLASDWEYEERTRWKDETPALNPPKKRSGVKWKTSSRPGKLKRMKMRSLRESGTGLTAGEPAEAPSSQPTPGSHGVRNDLGGVVFGPQQEDGYEEVVILQEDDEVFLEDEEKKEVNTRRRSAALGFSQRIIERLMMYDELIEGVPRVAFLEDLEIPFDERFF